MLGLIPWISVMTTVPWSLSLVQIVMTVRVKTTTAMTNLTPKTGYPELEYNPKTTASFYHCFYSHFILETN